MLETIGDYQVVKSLGSGRYADAFLVRKSGESRLKVLRRPKEGRRRERERFLHEATILKRLEQETDKIARLRFQGEFEGLPYLVTEYLNPDEYERFHGMTYLEEEKGLQILAQFAELLRVAHDLQIEVYDIKADHLFWDDERNELKVIDWNMAKWWGEGGEELSAEDEKAMREAFAQDLREFGKLMFSAFNGFNSGVPERRLPIEIKGLTSPIDFHALRRFSDGTKAIIEWLYGGGYDSAVDVELDLKGYLDGLRKGEQGAWLPQARERRTVVIEQCIGLGRAAGLNLDSAMEDFRRAWANIDGKRVELALGDEPRSKEVFLRILQSGAMGIGGKEADALDSGIDAWLETDYDSAIAALRSAAGQRHASLLLRRVRTESREHARRLAEQQEEKRERIEELKRQADVHCDDGEFVKAQGLLEQALLEDETNVDIKQEIQEIRQSMSLLEKKAWLWPRGASVEEVVRDTQEVLRQAVAQTSRGKALKSMQRACGRVLRLLERATERCQEGEYEDALAEQEEASKTLDRLLEKYKRAVGPSKTKRAMRVGNRVKARRGALGEMKSSVDEAIRLRDARSFDEARESLGRAKTCHEEHWGAGEHIALAREAALLDKESHRAEARQMSGQGRFVPAIEQLHEAMKCDLSAGGADQESLQREVAGLKGADNSQSFVEKGWTALCEQRYDAAGAYLDAAQEMDRARINAVETKILKVVYLLASELEETGV